MIFGTNCARCHEGECSGRLSFDHDSDAAATHIRRYTGAPSRASIREFFALLELMKTECSYPRPDVEIPADGIWRAGLLGRLCIPSQHSCFVPLGNLLPSAYSVAFEFREEPHVHVEVVTRTFAHLLDQPLEIADGSATTTFRVPERTEHFLRLRGDDAIHLDQVRLVELK